MSKRKNIIPTFSTEFHEKFINYIMLDGKKSIARGIFNDMLKILKKKGENDPAKAFERAIKNITPYIEVRAKRIGGSVYQIPVEVKPKRQLALAFRWILNAARSRKGMPMAEKLALEVLDAISSQGAAYKKKEDVFKMAQANKAFAHLARY